MKLLTMKNLNLGNSTHIRVATPNLKSLRGNILGAFLILTLSSLSIGILLFPQIAELSRPAFSELTNPARLLAGIALAGFLVTAPATWLIWSIKEYRNAQQLDRMGTLVKGSVEDKWMSESDGKQIFYVRYKYSVQVDALQLVDMETFQQLDRNESVFVLHLENQPQVSRLDLD